MNALGSCCICETALGVRNIIQLHKKAPTPGLGWGCFVCGLAGDGAVAVLCDDCMADFAEGREKLRLACDGYPKSGGRVPIEKLAGVHDHDLRFHPEKGAL